MSYIVKESKSFSRPASDMIASTSQVLGGLGGKLSRKSKPKAGYFDITFNKKINDKGKKRYINNRVQLHVKIEADSAEQSQIAVEAYPVNPIGQKLMFGVRGQPARFVIDTFWAELEA